MKEKDYLLAQELSNVRMITHLIGELSPNRSKLISDKQFKVLGEIAHQWQDKLFKEIQNNNNT